MHSAEEINEKITSPVRKFLTKFLMQGLNFTSTHLMWAPLRSHDCTGLFAHWFVFIFWLSPSLTLAVPVSRLYWNSISSRIIKRELLKWPLDGNPTVRLFVITEQFMILLRLKPIGCLSLPNAPLSYSFSASSGIPARLGMPRSSNLAFKTAVVSFWSQIVVPPYRFCVF